MNISYDWLRRLVPISLSPREAAEIITARACPVDTVLPLRADLGEIVVGRVLTAAPHPNSDHLTVTTVDDGSGTAVEVVCGAPNVQAGHSYPFARVGVTIPGGLTLERRKIRGAMSNGMLCSARELGLGDDHEGVLDLGLDAAPGTPLLQVLPAGDWRIVLDVTPNRPDLLSHLGVARELAAATGAPLALPAIEGAGAVPVAVRGAREGRAGSVAVVLEDAEGAPRYAGVVVRGVRVGPSPEWLADALRAVGSRPINNVVDATNYLLHELGQPMHAFDLAALAGGRVVVRQARAGERITTLDGVERALAPGMTVIADAERAQAVAGVLGGRESEVTERTTDIFLEIAAFAPARVRRTRRALGLSTDASYRFERGIDIEAVPAALERAVQLIGAVAGGAVDGAPLDLRPAPALPVVVHVPVASVERALGVALPAAEAASLLERVGFRTAQAGGAHETNACAQAHAAGGDAFDVTVPGWRPDVRIVADVVEEIARLRGYDSFPDALRPFRPGTVPDTPAHLVAGRVREALVRAGLLEARPLPFVRGGERGFVPVRNPIAADEAYLRRELLDTLARRAEYNLARMHRDVRLFEIGAAFAPGAAGGLPVEELRAAALILGHRRPPHWTESAPPDVDEWDAKGLAERLIHAARLDGVELAPGTGGDVLWMVRRAGVDMGVVRRVPLDGPVWAPAAFGVELTLAVLDARETAPRGTHRHGASPPGAEAAARAVVAVRALATTPAAEFDLALLVPNDLAAGAVEEGIRRAAGELLERLVLFDEYRGAGVPAGMRSLAWRLTFRHPERTLRDQEIAGRRARLLRTLEEELGVRQRTS